MPDEWPFDDNEFLDEPFKPGQPRCYHCGAGAPAGLPESYSRCSICGYHLHTCPNCMFYDGMGCLILEPHIWSDGAIMGKFCPSFLWRKDGEEPGTPRL